MPAEVEFVLGRAGSGKSGKLRSDISCLAKKGERVNLIVQEQFTFENERMLSSELGGLLGVSVISFTSLAHRVLKETGCGKTFLSPQGRRMLIRKIADENRKRLRAFGNVSQMPGFTQKCDELFTKCKRFLITPERLNSASEMLPEGDPLRNKLFDISLLYGETENFLKANYIDGDDLYNELCERIPKSSVAGSHVFVDGFERANEQIYSVMKKLMEHAASFTVSLRTDDSKGCRDAAVFEPDKRAYHKLHAMAKELGCGIKETKLPRNDTPWVRRSTPALSHLERELYAYPALEYAERQNCITVFEASDRVAETEALAAAVQKFSREGYRYRDMAVMTPDMDSYSSLIRREFTRRRIPFFMDAKRPLRDHPAVELIVSSLRCASRGFMQDDMLRLIKSGLCGLTGDEAEIFENFILQYGVKGNKFKEPFKQKDTPPEAEYARQTVMNPLLKLKEGLLKQTAGEKTEALYEYLVETEVFETLSDRVKSMEIAGRLELMEENAQVWNIIMELLSQVYEIMGGVKLASTRYIAILEEGLNAYEVGIIPTTIDQILVGSVGRTQRSGIKILFVTGCNEGLLPPVQNDDGVIDDAELAVMSEFGIIPWANTAESAEHDRLDIYGAFSKPTDSLWLSYTLSLEEGSGTPSVLIDKIKKIFPGTYVQSDIKCGTANLCDQAAIELNAKRQCENLYCPEAAIKTLIKQLRAFADSGERECVSCEFYAWFKRADEYEAVLSKIESALFYDPSPPPLGEELAEKLYKKHMGGSASSLETFAKCPFMHLVQYGLRASERPEAKDKPMEIGAFYHKALDEFTRKVLSGRLTWDKLHDADCDSIMDGILDKLVMEYRDGALLETARTRARYSRMSRVLKSTARAIARQLSPGDFRISGSEICFGRDQDYPPLVITGTDGACYELSGKIDRLDKSEDGKYFRIIDYKTNGAAFKFEELYEGIALQLPLYLAAALAAEETAQAAGMYYMPVMEPFADEKYEEPSVLTEKLYQKFRLKGLALSGAQPDRSISTSPPVSGEQLKLIMEYAVKKAVDILNRIKCGEAAVRPYSAKNIIACGFCPYKSVCGFDPRISACGCRFIKRMNMTDFFEKLEGENT